MIAINCEKINLSFGAETILENIAFALNEGDKLGIIGVNGAGKSSLFSIITGKYKQTSGEVFIARDKTVGILEQNIEYNSSSSILDEAYKTFSNLIKMEKELDELRKVAEKTESEEDAKRFSECQERFTDCGGYEFRGRCKGILKRLSFSEELWDKPVSTLSGGQKARLSLACLLLRDPDIILLDEPTNHLDTEALFWLENYLKSSKKTILVISHDRYFLDSVVNKILEIENKKSRLFNGNYTQYVNQKAVDRDIQERHFSNQQKEIKRIEAYIEQQRRWNRERNIIAAESRQKLLDKMEKVKRPEALPDKIRMSFEKSEESGNDVITVSGLEKSFPGKSLFNSVSFEVKKHDRLFICGKNGCGKSTLIKILAGKLSSDRGFVTRGYNVKLGYYDQENQDLNPANNVLDELWNSYPNLTETAVRNTLALFLFKGDDIFKPISVLSGGEKARLTLARLMLSKVNLLVLDEPTNHLDINSREILENALLAFDGTIIAVSHDRYFVNKLASHILDFGAESKGHLFFFDGGYHQYLEYKKNYLSPYENEQKETCVSASKEQYLNNKRELAEQRKIERKIKSLKNDIEVTENSISKTNEELSVCDAYNHVRMAELESQINSLEEKLLYLYEQLDSLEGM